MTQGVLGKSDDARPTDTAIVELLARVRIGAPEDAAALGYSFAFDWTEPTPAALFPALLVCALEAMKPKGLSR